MSALQGKLAASTWLAQADPSPDHAHRWWDARGIVLLPVGHKWDVVKVDARRAQQALADSSLTGPVISDGYYDPGTAYFLVPPRTSDIWDLDGTECLGDTCYLTVPAPDRVTGPGPHWIRPLEAPFGLTEPGRLRVALEAAR